MANLGDEPPGRRDRALVERALGGDRQAREAVVERLTCVPRFLRCRNDRFGRLLPEHEIQDLSQDILVVVWTKLGTFRGESDLEGWVYRYCDLQLRNHARKLIKRRQRETGEPNEAVAAPTADDVHRLDLAQRALAILDRLEQEEARIVRWRLLDDLAFPTIAARLAKPVNTVKTKFHRALARLRESILLRQEQIDE